MGSRFSTYDHVPRGMNPGNFPVMSPVLQISVSYCWDHIPVKVYFVVCDAEHMLAC